LIDVHVHLRDASELLSYLAYGVTTVVHLSGPTGNVPDVVELRGRVSKREVLGPSIYTTGRLLDGDPPVYPGVSVTVRTPEDARRVVASQVDAGVDFIKVYNNLSEDALRAAVAAAHERRRAVFGHIPRAGGRAQALQAALRAGLDVIAHAEEYFFTYFYDDIEAQLDKGLVPTLSEDRIPEAVRLTREAGAAVTPNLSFVAMTRAQLDDLPRVLEDPETCFLHPGVVAMWRGQNPTTRRDLGRFDRRERAKYGFIQRLTLALSRAGVPLLLGTDASSPALFPGKSAHLELQELVRAGLTPFEAIAAGTRTAGTFMAYGEPGAAFGTITPGSRADSILLRGNPLDDVANASTIEGVLVRGAWFTSQELRERRERAAIFNGR
jgi:imidazolonepropionase-like amidohydrolase